MSAVLDLTCELMRRVSVSPADAGCQPLLIRRLQACGFAVEPLHFAGVDNFWATRGAEASPTLCFAGHTDVVPSGPVEEWTSPPFEPSVRDGLLFGRGAADMKSALAAMTIASEEFVSAQPRHRGRLAFLITSDEEGPSIDGTRRVVEWLRERGERIDWCVLGEPSSENTLGDTLKIGRRGSLSGRLTVLGVQGHIAYPHLASNPVHAFAPALAELVSREWDRGNAHFQPTSFQVSNFNAGTGAPNVIPGELKVRFNLRFSTEQTVESLQRSVGEILGRHQVPHRLEWFVSGQPFYCPPGTLSDAAGEAIEAHCGIRPQLSTGGGTSDGRFIAALGAQIIELGVINRSIHKVDEHVRLDDVEKLRVIYLDLLHRLLT